MYVGSLYLYGGRTSVTETVRLIVTIIQLYYMLLWRLSNFTNKNHPICIFITMPIIFCNLISKKCIIILYYQSIAIPALMQCRLRGLDTLLRPQHQRIFPQKERSESQNSKGQKRRKQIRPIKYKVALLLKPSSPTPSNTEPTR